MCVGVWVCGCGRVDVAYFRALPKNEMLSDWALIVFVFSLRVLGTPTPRAAIVANRTHTHTHALSVI